MLALGVLFSVRSLFLSLLEFLYPVIIAVDKLIFFRYSIYFLFLSLPMDTYIYLITLRNTKSCYEICEFRNIFMIRATKATLWWSTKFLERKNTFGMFLWLIIFYAKKKRAKTNFIVYVCFNKKFNTNYILISTYISPAWTNIKIRTMYSCCIQYFLINFSQVLYVFSLNIWWTKRNL